MSRENYSSEPEEFIASLKEKLEGKEVEIRELQQQIELLKGINEEYLNELHQIKTRIEELDESKFRPLEVWLDYECLYYPPTLNNLKKYLLKESTLAQVS